MPPGSAISHFILNTSNSSRRPCFLQSWDKGVDIWKGPLVSSSREVTGSHVVNGEETHEGEDAQLRWGEKSRSHACLCPCC